MLERPLERAFALARTGRFKTKSEIARAMKSEGYTYGDLACLEGVYLSRQISSICASVRMATA